MFKVLASSLVYNISDGQFTSRADLLDAAGSSLGRGALVPGLGKEEELLIWAASTLCSGLRSPDRQSPVSSSQVVTHACLPEPVL